MNGKADVIQMEQALHHLQLTKDQFLSMCVVAGCDYLKNIKGIGIYKPKQLVKKDNLISELQKQKNAPQNYGEAFLKARNVFKHQLVFHPVTKKVKPLQEWGDGEDNQGSSLFGHYPFSSVQTVNSMMGY